MTRHKTYIIHRRNKKTLEFSSNKENKTMSSLFMLICTTSSGIKNIPVDRCVGSLCIPGSINSLSMATTKHLTNAMQRQGLYFWLTIQGMDQSTLVSANFLLFLQSGMLYYGIVLVLLRVSILNSINLIWIYNPPPTHTHGHWLPYMELLNYIKLTSKIEHRA